MELELYPHSFLPPLPMVPNMGGLVIVGTRSGLIFEQLVLN